MGIEGLQFQAVDVVFNKGLDTRTNPKLVAPGDWLQLENVTFSADNTPRLRDSIQPVTGNNVSFNSLVTHGQQAIAFRGPDAVALNPTSAGPSVSGKAGFVKIKKSGIASENNITDSYDCASINGFTCYVWRNKNSIGTVTGVSVSVYDEQSGNLVSVLTNFGGSSVRSPRVVGCNSTNFVVTWMENSTGTPTMQALGIDTVYGGNVLFGTPTTMFSSGLLNITVGAGTDMVGVPVASLGSHAMVFYPLNAAQSVYGGFLAISGTTVTWISAIGLISAALCPAAKVTGIAACAFQNGTQVFVAASNSTAATGTYALVLNTSPLSITTPTTQIDSYVNAENPAAGSIKANGICACAVNGGIKWFTDNAISYNQDFAGSPRKLRTGTVDASLTALVAAYDLCSANFYDQTLGSTVPIGPQGPIICGKPLFDGTRTILPVRTLESYSDTLVPPRNSNTQNCFFLLEGNTAACVGGALSGSLGVQGRSFGFAPISTPCSIPLKTGTLEPGANEFVLMVPESTRVVLSGGANVSPVNPARLTIDPSYSYSMPRVEVGPNAMTGLGVISSYDGAAIVESGFLLYPEGISLSVAAAAASVTPGVHRVVAIYEWTDANGQRHQSAPSNYVEATTVAGDRIAVRVPSLQLTQRQGVSVGIFMTPVGSATFYRCSTNNGVIGSVLYNSGAFTYVTWTITESDADLVKNEILYTQPGFVGSMLPNVAPPPITCLGVHQDRVFCDVADQPNTYRFSQRFSSGTGLQWSDRVDGSGKPLLGGSVEATAGGIVGWAPLDDKMIMFCANRIYALFGTGPDASGAYSQYSDPVPLPADVGCTTWRSIVKMPDGIIFKSPKGWYQLGRDLVVKYIGAPVKAYDSAIVYSGVLHDKQQECRWSVGSEGVTLVYSYIGGQWSITRYAPIAYSPAPGWPPPGAYSPIDAIIYPARSRVTGYGYIHCAPLCGVNGDWNAGYLDTYGGYSSGFQFPSMLIQTSFLRLGSINGFQRVRWLYLTMSQLAPGSPNSAAATLTLWFNDATAGDAGVDYYSTSFNLGTATATGTANTVELRHKMLRQKCKSVSMQLSMTPSIEGLGPLGFQSMQLQVGVKRGTNKLPAANSIG